MSNPTEVRLGCHCGFAEPPCDYCHVQRGRDDWFPLARIERSHPLRVLVASFVFSTLLLAGAAVAVRCGL